MFNPNDGEHDTPRLPIRNRRARRLVALRRERLAAEAELQRLGGMRGRVRPEQRPLSWCLDAIEAPIQMVWMEAA